MKNFSAVLNIILLVAVGILYFLFFKGDKPSSTTLKAGPKDTSRSSSSIAYFDMDSVENQYIEIKNLREQLKADEQVLTNELDGLKSDYTKRMQELQAQAKTMTQEQGENAQAEIYKKEQTIRQKEAENGQKLQVKQFNMVQQINKKIEEFLKSYNSQGKYAYIFSHSPGDFIYYKDSVYNITNDIVSGLNAGVIKK